VQRDDTEYEFDIVLDIARNHIASASKDVTFLDTYGDIISVDLGQKLKTWLDNGLEPAPKTVVKPKQEKPKQTNQKPAQAQKQEPAPAQQQKPAATPPTPTPEQMAEVAHQKINEVKLSTIRKELDRTGVQEAAICKRYGFAALADCTEELFVKVMSALSKTKTKGAQA
jgi:pyruvate/2-oxoglutarate dehydrogenase complex dihydrolipoamide acyltransferase (E2) component